MTVEGEMTLGATTPAGLDLAAAVRELTYAIERQRVLAGRALFNVGSPEMIALGWLFIDRRTPTQLAERLQLTTAAVTKLVDRLAAQNLVERLAHPRDRRMLLIALTEHARTKLAELFSFFANATSQITAHLAPHELHLVIDTLHRLTEATTTLAPPRLTSTDPTLPPPRRN